MQLTWQEKKVLIWEIEFKDGLAHSLKLNQTKSMPKNNYIQQGWGVAKLRSEGSELAPNHLIATDGTFKMKLVDLDNWAHVKTQSVYKNT
mmetsp:Transcript_11476/g.19418  ORF Transcript_11476/g.19418 Transcript_11476/m.19418 type:complete len:90 (+) Transcript_11476:553-822(+)